MYGADVVIPAEMGIKSHQVLHFDEARNEELMKEDLDILEEEREIARLKFEKYKSQIRAAYNRRVCTRSFVEGDLILRRVDALKPNQKLDPNWEGPYRVI